MSIRYKILTDDGFVPFDGITKSTREACRLFLSDGRSITTSLSHRFFVGNKEFTASTLRPGFKFSDSSHLVSIKSIGTIDLYDPVNVGTKHRYLSGGLLHHNCHFLGSSDTLISSSAISMLSPTRPIFENGGLVVFERPISEDLSMGTAGRIYVMVVDPSKGTGGDYSAFTIMDVTEIPYRMVARYRDNKISPLLFPNIIYKVATEYNKAFVLIEINASEQIPYILHQELEYEHLLMVKRNSRGQEISGGWAGVTLLMGVNTDKKIKRVGCSNFKALVEEQKLLIPDEVTIAEISTFVAQKASWGADDGYHDDVVMTLVLFGWLTSQDYFRELNDINLRKALFNQQMDMIEQSLTPFGYVQDGNEEEEVHANF